MTTETNYEYSSYDEQIVAGSVQVFGLNVLYLAGGIVLVLIAPRRSAAR